MNSNIKLLVLIGLAAVAISRAFGGFSGDLLQFVENPDGILAATYNGSALTVIPTGADSWTVQNPYPGISGPGAWKEPDWAANNTWNVIYFNGANGITVQSDVPVDGGYFNSLVQQYGNRFEFNNGANHVLYNNDSPDGTPDGGGPRSQNVQFIDGTVVPEPSTVIAGALLLLPFGLGAMRSLRKQQTA